MLVEDLFDTPKLTDEQVIDQWDIRSQAVRARRAAVYDKVKAIIARAQAEGAWVESPPTSGQHQFTCLFRGGPFGYMLSDHPETPKASKLAKKYWEAEQQLHRLYDDYEDSLSRHYNGEEGK